jgi:DNA-binding NtrC family response regulator
MSARILLIDDDPGLSEVLGMLFEREGYVALRAATVKEGLRLVESGAPDVVVTDLKLPDGTGLDAINAIRARHPALPVIMITSYSTMESAIGALRGGAVDYVIKPFKNEALLNAIARALQHARMASLPGGPRPLAIEEYIREVIERFQGSYSETELARMLGIGRKALWMRRRQWGLKRPRKSVS